MDKKNLYLLTLSCLAILMIPVQSVYLGDAASNNLAYAMSLYEKGEPLFYRRGPLYYGMIALFFKLFGPTVEHAVWVTRLFVPVNLLLVYIMARTMINQRAAVVSVTLVFFSFALNTEAAKLEADNVMPTFMLSSLWLFWMSTKKGNLKLATAAGFLLGLGWLVKEASMFYLPLFLLPFLFKDFRNKAQGLRTGVAFLTFGITLTPWLLYILSKGATIQDVFGAASPKSTVEHLRLSMSFSTYVFDNFVLNAPSNLLNYFDNYFRPNFPLWLPILGSLLYSVYWVFRTKSLELTFLLGGIFLFLPIAIYQGGIGERLGQCYVIFLLSYIILSFTVDEITKRIMKGSVSVVFPATIFILVVFELFNPLGPINKSTFYIWGFSDRRLSIMNSIIRWIPQEFLNRTARAAGLPDQYKENFSRLLEESQKKGFQLGERFDEGIQEAANWIVKNIEENTLIYCAGNLTESLPFYTGFRFQFKSFGGANSDVRYFATTGRTPDLTQFKEERLLGVISPYGFQNKDILRAQMLLLLFEPPFIENLNHLSAKFLVLHKADAQKKRNTDFHHQYFAQHANLLKVFENHRTTIYQITRPFVPFERNNPFIYINPELQDDLAWLKEHFPTPYEKLVADLSPLLPEDHRVLLIR